MEKIYEDRIIQELDKIKDELLKYEQITIDMISCDIDEIEPHSRERMTITGKIDKVFGRIDLLLSEMDGGERVRSIIRSSKDLTEIAPDEEKVYFKTQEIVSLIHRIKDSDVQVIDRIDLEKSGLLDKIKEENKGTGAKAAKFMVGTNEGRQKFVGYGGKMI